MTYVSTRQADPARLEGGDGDGAPDGRMWREDYLSAEILIRTDTQTHADYRCFRPRWTPSRI